MSNNPITTSGALTVIYAVKLNSTSVMKSLDLSVNAFDQMYSFRY